MFVSLSKSIQKDFSKGEHNTMKIIIDEKHAENIADCFNSAGKIYIV